MEGNNNIEVPFHFLCPISLQLMRDPVTVSTGITYDRENIERWLFTCKNNTCPVTKQSLFDSADLTPNHTLRRLIQSWCTLNAFERIPTPKSPIDKTQIVKLLNEAKSFPNGHIQCLSRLKSIASQSERNKNCLEEAGAIEFLISLIKKKKSEPSSTTLETAIEVLFHFKGSETRLRNLMKEEDSDVVIESLVRVLKCGNYKSRAHATILLKSLLEVADPIQLVSLETELFREVVNVLRDHQISQQASKAALKLLVEISPWGRNRIKAIEGGAVWTSIELLLGSLERRGCELLLTLLEQLCGCAEGREELLKHAAGVAVVSKKILRVSHLASEKAVRILSSISRFSANSRVVHEMLQVGVVAKLCLVLQVDTTSFKSKAKAKEVLKLHSRVWKNSTCVPPHLLSSYPSS